jgi:hypothetical protein
MRARNISAAWLVLANAVLTMLVGTGVVDWSDAQVALVYAEVNTVSALLLALYLHFYPDTKREPVAVAASLTAVAVSTTALLSGFQVWHLNDAQNALVVSVVSALVALVATAFARQQVVAEVAPPTEHTPGPVVNPEGQGEL